ncbi:unnamed protein product [Adineta steineri]|uniref:G-protein coupled receptors family 1 profile domain-containing protein n=1 Tax=Adineta steineri TaxID=433720 RepID=A0A819C155_9BILA|nr:unnamed protein product [Adineta steineri]CAF3805248.1 unnamed protein product [Adineta steineri]
MSSTTITTQTTTSSLTVIQNLITQYTFTVIFIIGNFSNLANILVFLQKTLRLNASRYFLCFISIDRWLIIFGLCFCILFSINFPIWCQIDGSKDCTGAPNTFYPLFYTSYNLVITIGPFLIMILFSLLILRNLRQGHRRQVIATTQTNIARLSINVGQQFHRKDIQFIKLSFIQVCLYILFNAFYGYNATYAFITQSTIKTAEQTAFNSFLSTIGLNINYLYMAITFFSYTLVSSTFRKECFFNYQTNCIL